jgi:hypothetical protein
VAVSVPDVLDAHSTDEPGSAGSDAPLGTSAEKPNAPGIRPLGKARTRVRSDARNPLGRDDADLASGRTRSPAKPTSTRVERIGANVGGRPSSLQIVLSAGVAQPQSLPTGTAIGFSVDYRVSSGEPSASGQYHWRIKSVREQSVSIPIPKLAGEGTLQAFVSRFRPEDGPFEMLVLETVGSKSRAVSAPLSVSIPSL